MKVTSTSCTILYEVLLPTYVEHITLRFFPNLYASAGNLASVLAPIKVMVAPLSYCTLSILFPTCQVSTSGTLTVLFPTCMDTALVLVLMRFPCSQAKKHSGLEFNMQPSLHFLGAPFLVLSSQGPSGPWSCRHVGQTSVCLIIFCSCSGVDAME